MSLILGAALLGAGLAGGAKLGSALGGFIASRGKYAKAERADLDKARAAVESGKAGIPLSVQRQNMGEWRRSLEAERKGSEADLQRLGRSGKVQSAYNKAQDATMAGVAAGQRSQDAASQAQTTATESYVRGATSALADKRYGRAVQMGADLGGAAPDMAAGFAGAYQAANSAAAGSYGDYLKSLKTPPPTTTA